jgi:hypothetical protein
VENSGSVTFESFYAWYVQHFDPVSGERLNDEARAQRATAEAAGQQLLDGPADSA